MPKSITVSYIQAFLAMTFWAVTFVWVKVALISYHPLEIVFLRLVLATSLLFFVAYIMRIPMLPARADMPWFILVAFCEPFCYFMGEAFGMQYVSSTLGSLIISIIPLVTALGAWILLREKISWLLIAGLIISFGGVLLLTLDSTDFYATLKGVLLMLLAVFSGMFYGITVRRLTLKYDSFIIVSWQSLFGMLFFLPLFVIFDGKHFFHMQHSLLGLYTIGGMSIFASVLAFLLFTGVIRELGVIRSNLFTNLIPVLTVALAFLFLGDVPNLRTLLGVALVLAGLFISQFRDIRRVVIPAE